MTPYAYRTGDTALHRAGAGMKLLGLCALSLASFFAGIPGLLIASAGAGAAALLGRLGPRDLFSGSLPLAATTAAVVALRGIVLEIGTGASLGFDPAGAAEGLRFAWGVFASYAAGAVLFATTTTAELRFALAGAERKARRVFARLFPFRFAEKAASFDLSLALALALAFIPRVFVVWEAAEEAHLARGGRKGVCGMGSLVPLVAERLIEAAAETAHALESRGYSGPESID